MSEDRKSKLDRELIELLNELRVALPGVQVLFAFLLTVPFSNRFADLTSLQRAVFFVAFLSTAAASALLMAPTAYHRLRWRSHDKEAMLVYANRLAIAGLAILALAIVCAVLLIADVLLDGWAAAATATGIGLVLVSLWFGLPVSREVRDEGARRRAAA